MVLAYSQSRSSDGMKNIWEELRVLSHYGTWDTSMWRVEYDVLFWLWKSSRYDARNKRKY